MPARYSAITVLGFGALLAGCSALPFRGEERRSAPPPLPPLAAAPTGSVSETPLPPPTGMQPPLPGQAGAPSGLAALNPGVSGPPGALPGAPGALPGTPGALPGAPGALPPPGGLPPVPGAPQAGPATTAAVAAPTGVDVGRTDLLGGWKINAAGESCQLFMTLTTWSGGYRASTKGCKNPAVSKISAWNMQGRQIQLLDDSNGTVARLYASSKTQYDGQTEGGGPVSVTR